MSLEETVDFLSFRALTDALPARDAISFLRAGDKDACRFIASSRAAWLIPFEGFISESIYPTGASSKKQPVDNWLVLL